MASKICGAHFSDIQYAGATLAEVDRCFTFAADDDEGMDCTASATAAAIGENHECREGMTAPQAD